MLAVIDPSRLEKLRCGANCPETRKPLDAIDGHRPGKTLRFEHGKAALPQLTQANIDIVGLEHQAVETAWALKHVLAQDFCSRRQADQLEVMALENHQMVDRSKRVIASRRQREAEL